MYQTLVLGLGVLLLAGTGYFIKHTDSQGVIRASLSTTASSGVGDLSQSVAGVYICDSSSGCSDVYTLILSSNGEAKMTSSFDGGVEVVEEFGTWQVYGNVATIALAGTAQILYSEPHVIISSDVSSVALSSLSTDASVYDGFVYAQFRKQTMGLN